MSRSYISRNYLLFYLFLFFLIPITSTTAKELRVVASIAPLHSLAASLMAGVEPPVLLMRQNASPHDFRLTPSKASLLTKSDIVFWIGKNFESALSRSLQNLPMSTRIIALGGKGCTDGVRPPDYHVWLSPAKAMGLVREIRTALIHADPEHTALYQKNGSMLLRRLKTLDEELAMQLQPVSNKRYLVFHDAYSCLEQRYKLVSGGYFRHTPHALPGARHLHNLRQAIKAGKIECIFSEPGFLPGQIRAIIAETRIKTGVLDPLGISLQPGPELYFNLMRNLAAALRACLGNPKEN